MGAGRERNGSVGEGSVILVVPHSTVPKQSSAPPPPPRPAETPRSDAAAAAFLEIVYLCPKKPRDVYIPRRAKNFLIPDDIRTQFPLRRVLSVCASCGLALDERPRARAALERETPGRFRSDDRRSRLDERRGKKGDGGRRSGGRASERASERPPV